MAGEALPAISICPLCHEEQLQVYEDSSLGPWCACQHCQTSGTVCDWGNKLWGLPLGEVREYMAKHGACLPWSAAELTEALSSGFLHARHRLLLFCQKYGGQMPTANVGPAAHRFYMPVERWQAYLASVLGSAGLHAISSAFGLGLGDASLYTRYGTQRDESTIIAAHQDAPGRLCGLRLIGNHDAFHSLTTEAGLGFLPALRHSVDVVGDKVIAMPDAWWAARLHARHTNTSLRPLPLLSWYDDGRAHTRRAWQSLMGRTPVVWDWHASAASFCQAILCDGQHSDTGPNSLDRASVTDFLDLHNPYRLLRNVVSAAKPWPEALGAWLLRVDDNTAATLLLTLKRRNIDAKMVGELLPARCRERWGRLTLPAAKQRTICLGGKIVIVETAAGWFYQGRTNRRISDTIIRVEKIQQVDGEKHYIGRLSRPRRDVTRFDVPGRVFEAKPIDTIIELMMNRHGKRPSIDRNWERSLLDIAFKFLEPTNAGSRLAHTASMRSKVSQVAFDDLYDPDE